MDTIIITTTTTSITPAETRGSGFGRGLVRRLDRGLVRGLDRGVMVMKILSSDDAWAYSGGGGGGGGVLVACVRVRAALMC